MRGRVRIKDGGPVLALSGGVGGAKLALGLYRVLPRNTLTVVANTGDDFTHLGLSVSPDIDTLLYTLSGLANEEQGWGRRDETWNFMAALERLGGESWFRLGDGDLATHVERTRRLAAGESLTAITDHFARRLGIAARILPMSDERVRTRIRSARGWLDFQDYFVRLHCEPVVREIVFAGAADAAPHGDTIGLLRDPALRVVAICPSNPFISIDPILSLPSMRAALRDCPAPVVAVSPIIGGKAVKGPTAKMMEELGLPVDAAAVARHYGDLIDVYIADDEDADAVAGLDVPVVLTHTLMTDLADREALARAVLAAPERIPDVNGVWAVVPIKDITAAKQRLAEAAPAEFRRKLALAMAEDVLAALAGAKRLAGTVVVTVDPGAAALAQRYGAQVWDDGALDGHTGAVTAAGRRLTAEGAAGMLTVPGDIPTITAEEVDAVISAHLPAPSFTIVPAHDELGSNAILMSPPDAVPLRFGDASFFPHLAAAEACGIKPTVLRLPGIAFDIDNPVDLAHFSRLGSQTRAGRLLAGGLR